MLDFTYLTMQNQSYRIEWVDTMKGILIFFVVLGHVVGPGAHLAPDALSGAFQGIHDYLYLFHMPAFFFIAGALWKRKEEDISLSAFIVKKSRRLMLPYFAIGLISAVVFCITRGGNVPNNAFYDERTTLGRLIPFVALLHGGRWPNGLGFTPNSVLWFLPCMFSLEIVWRLICNIRNRHFRNVSDNKFALTVLLIMFALAYCVRVSGIAYWPMGIHKVPFYLMFFILGKIVPKEKIIVIAKKHSTSSIVMIVIMSFAIWLIRQSSIWDEEYLSIFPYLLAAYLGIGMVWLIAVCCQAKKKLVALIGMAGCNSMVIMLLHKFPVVYLQFHLPFIKNCYSNLYIGILTSVAISLLAIFICHAVGSLATRMHAGWMLGHS